MSFLEDALKERENAGTLRTLFVPDGLIDFASNDYLGFAKSAHGAFQNWSAQSGVLKKGFEMHPSVHANPIQEVENKNKNGSTGSRLISGNSRQAEALEHRLAAFHEAEAGLLFNSGYDANVGLLSCLAQKGDTYLSDAFIHASMIDGIRLSKANRLKFKHNDLEDVAHKLAFVRGQGQASNIFICIESVYSMDGDVAHLQAMCELATQYNAYLIVDEAHATGIIGRAGEGLVQSLDLQGRVLARVHTFGKAMGAHGAVVLGSKALRSYLINFARAFIYTTALPAHSLQAIEAAYNLLESPFFQQERQKLQENIQLYQQLTQTLVYPALASDTAIQGIMIGDNTKAKNLQTCLQTAGIYAKAILSPTVPIGTERLRICLHSFNTTAQIHQLLDLFR